MSPQGATGIAIVDSGSGNLRSVTKALERVAAGRVPVTVTRDPETVRRAARVVLPGQGAFADVKAGLAAIDGMLEAVTENARQAARPFLGICVGMQLMVETSFEHGQHAGFGWLPGSVVPLAPADPALKVPHMGWNTLDITAPSHPVMAGLPAGAHAYFVHSFRVAPDHPQDLLAQVEHGGPVAAAIGRENLLGVQFHPEKSQSAGLALLEAFLDWNP